jgi:hypothetical protein
MNSTNNKGAPLLPMVAALLPTPTARDWKSSNASQATMERNSRPLNETLTGGKGGQLNPQFVLEMMGFPPDWMELPFQSGDQNQ